jgi:hypothetical protein
MNDDRRHEAGTQGNLALQTRADSARVESGYEKLDPAATKNAFEGLDELLTGLAGQVVHTLDQMIPHLAEMQALLSQRGKARKKVLKQAGLPSWSEYAREYAQKLDCSMRTVQDHIQIFRNEKKSGGSKVRPNNPIKLDARQQSSLVKAQLAANDLVSALNSGGDWKTPLAEYEKVAVTPATLDGYMAALNPEPDWKSTLSHLVAVLEQHHDNLPASVVAEMRVVQELFVPTPTKGQPENPGIAADNETTSADLSCPTEVRLDIPAEARQDSINLRHLAPVHEARQPAPRTAKIAPPINVTICAPAHDNEDEGSCERTLSDAAGYLPAPLARHGYVLNENGKLEFVGVDEAA